MVSLHKQERENRSSSQVLQQPWKALHVCPPLQHQFQNQSQCSLSPVLRLDLARELGCPHRASLVTLFPFPLPCLCLLGYPKSLSASRVPEPPKSTQSRGGAQKPLLQPPAFPASAPAWVAQQPQLSSLAATGGSQI